MKNIAALFIFLLAGTTVFGQNAYFAAGKKIFQFNLGTSASTLLYEAPYEIKGLALNSKNELYGSIVVNYKWALVKIDMALGSVEILSSIPGGDIKFNNQDELFVKLEYSGSPQAGIVKFDLAANQLTDTTYFAQYFDHFDFDPAGPNVWATYHRYNPGESDMLFEIAGTEVVKTLEGYYDVKSIAFDNDGNLFAITYGSSIVSINKQDGQVNTVADVREFAPGFNVFSLAFPHEAAETSGLVADKSSIDFGLREPETSAAVSFKIKNAGLTAVEINAADLPGAPFAVEFASGVVEAGEFLSGTVSFHPQAPGTWTGQITIQYDTDKTLAIPVAGSSKAFAKAESGVIYAAKETSEIHLLTADLKPTAEVIYTDLHYIQSLTIDGNGNLFALNAGQVHRVDPESGGSHRLADQANLVFSGIYTDIDNDLYAWESVARENLNRIYRFNPVTTQFELINEFSFSPDDFGNIENVDVMAINPYEKVLIVKTYDEGYFRIDLTIPNAATEFLFQQPITIEVSSLFFTADGEMIGIDEYEEAANKICPLNGSYEKKYDAAFFPPTTLNFYLTTRPEADRYNPALACTDALATKPEIRHAPLVYPNPVSDELTLAAGYGTRLVVLSLEGNVVANLPLPPTRNEQYKTTAKDLGMLKKGTYLMLVYEGEKLLGWQKVMRE